MNKLKGKLLDICLILYTIGIILFKIHIKVSKLVAFVMGISYEKVEFPCSMIMFVFAGFLVILDVITKEM
jgi:hypothetical protein